MPCLPVVSIGNVEGVFVGGIGVTGSLPRYFVARADAPEPVLGQAPPAIMQIIDSFLTGGRHRAETEHIVGVDALGNLQICSMSEARQFDELLQNQMTFNEISADGRRRMLCVSRFYLFALQLLEQPGDSPGINDPVYLYGKLFGVYPDAPNSLAVEGQLTVTRADILSGIVEGEKYGFTYAAGSNYSSMPTRCFHLMVPGDSESELNRGAGIVVVYPLPTAELAAADSANESVTKQMLFDILQSLKKDIKTNNLKSGLSKVDLPVPSRHCLESDLQARGYVIKGNTAIRKVPGVGPFDGVLESLFGKLVRDKLDLPPEGSLSEFMELARLALKETLGWPPERTKTTARLCRLASMEEIERASKCNVPTPVRQSKTPRGSAKGDDSAQRCVPTVQSQGNAPANRGVPNWMKDFMSAHKSNSAATTTSTTSQNGKRRPPEKVDWMKDFDDPGIESNQSQPQSKTQPQPERADIKPDWMKDFQ